jgi:hypothetical protein
MRLRHATKSSGQSLSSVRGALGGELDLIGCVLIGHQCLSDFRRTIGDIEHVIW